MLVAVVNLAAEAEVRAASVGVAEPWAALEGPAGVAAMRADVVGSTASRSIRSTCRSPTLLLPQSTMQECYPHAEAQVAPRRVTRATQGHQVTPVEANHTRLDALGRVGGRWVGIATRVLPPVKVVPRLASGLLVIPEGEVLQVVRQRVGITAPAHEPSRVRICEGRIRVVAVPVEAPVGDLAIGDHRPDRANRGGVPVELGVVMSERKESAERKRLGRERAVSLYAFNRRQDTRAPKAVFECDRLASDLGDAYAAHVVLLLPPAVKVQVFHTPARREAVQRHKPAVRDGYVAHEWLDEPDAWRIEQDFGDLVPFFDLHAIGPNRGPVRINREA
eukprot:scaffold67450_cov63-Phaeocystis_antarctica.AAC.1